jgi:hypothetical protein
VSGPGFQLWDHHDCERPSFNLLVELGAAAHLDAQAAVVPGTGVLPDCPRLVSFDQGTAELCVWYADGLQPEVLCRSEVCGLMNADPENQPVWCDAHCLKEMQEELDHQRVAVDEVDAIGATVRLVLRPLAPVGDRTRDEDLAIGEIPYSQGRQSRSSSR